MWKSLLLTLVLMGCSPSIINYGKSTYYPLVVGYEWTYFKYDRANGRSDTVVIKVADAEYWRDSSLFHLSAHTSFKDWTIEVLKTDGSILWRESNEWTVKLRDNVEPGDIWYYVYDYYEVICKRILSLYGKTYNTAQIYREGCRSDTYWVALDTGIVKMYVGQEIWNLMSFKRRTYDSMSKL